MIIMKWNNKWLAGALSLQILLGSSIAFAEQPAAEKYRNIIQSGNFYVEYGPKGWGLRDYVVAQNGVRMSGLKLEKMFGTTSYPAVRYDNGKYYKFVNKGTVKREEEIANNEWKSYQNYESYQDAVVDSNTYNNGTVRIGGRSSFYGGVFGGSSGGEYPKKTTGVVLEESNLNNPYLNPDAHWEKVRARLSLPAALKIFAYNDPYMGHEYGENEPVFIESGQVEDNGKQRVCDKYTSVLKDNKGNVKAEMVYTAIYDEKGNLYKINKVCKINGKVLPVDELEIVTITDVLPEKAIDMPKSKIYAADTGTITDLLKKPTLIEEIK